MVMPCWVPSVRLPVSLWVRLDERRRRCSAAVMPGNKLARAEELAPELARADELARELARAEVLADKVAGARGS